MIITRAMAAAVVFAGAAIGLASPAWAEELSGTYQYVAQSSQQISGFEGEEAYPDPAEDAQGQWTLAPCGNGCTRVTSANGWTADMNLVGGRWQMTRPNPSDQWLCDGQPTHTTLEYSFDATTLSGTIRTVGQCRGKPGYSQSPASLTKVG